VSLSRENDSIDWGLSVGAHLMRFWLFQPNDTSIAASIHAETSFLPPWRAISTENVSPCALETLSSTALKIAI